MNTNDSPDVVEQAQCTCLACTLRLERRISLTKTGASEDEIQKATSGLVCDFDDDYEDDEDHDEDDEHFVECSCPSCTSARSKLRTNVSGSKV